MEAECFSKGLVFIYQIGRSNNPEGSILIIFIPTDLAYFA
jgi:hypothetical protein